MFTIPPPHGGRAAFRPAMSIRGDVASIFHFHVDCRFPSFTRLPRSRPLGIRKLSCAPDQLHRPFANRVLLSALATRCQLALVSVESLVPIFMGANRVSRYAAAS